MSSAPSANSAVYELKRLAKLFRLFFIPGYFLARALYNLPVPEVNRPSKIKHGFEKQRIGEWKMAVEKTIGSSSLVEVIDRILDKGVVIDAWIRISLVGIELLAIEARIVVASVETYLKYAEAIGLTAKAA